MALATQTRAAQAARARGAGLKDTRKSLCRQLAIAPRAALASPPFCLGPAGSPGHHRAAWAPEQLWIALSNARLSSSASASSPIGFFLLP